MNGYFDDPLVEQVGLHDISLVVTVSIFKDREEIIIKAFGFWISEEREDKQHEWTIFS